MNIYRDCIWITRFPFLKAEPGKFFNRMVGLNVSGAGIEPVYQAILHIENHGNLCIHITTRYWSSHIVLIPRYPFFFTYSENGEDTPDHLSSP